MGKIAGWTKFQDSYNITRWRNEKYFNAEVRVAGPSQLGYGKAGEHVGDWFVELPNQPEPIWYENRDDAMARAVRYMRTSMGRNQSGAMKRNPGKYVVGE